ncbi:hypothetical protein CHL67_06965 [Prosthecochloris sp. GSB1]|uniref:fibrobacter succinogenes major paralogous domain-containing protein n=1 Tax=Prosthecochloris sp. GSB1 TaxID=281093 RepID=UPI000B8C94D3|nr:fibrobacter succinogenes major paralogous domain-containing protein [Prosthecochloris sp. GSB1]ASQ90700.1 hypothetical protein CHL67_06965 [Prosthecochloris sp. GSB1]
MNCFPRTLFFPLVVFLFPLFVSCSGQMPAGPVDAGTVTDVDGNVYKAVKIGDQIWMAENLVVKHYRNGDPIPEVRELDEWVALESGAWSVQENAPEHGKLFGKLYNWYAVNDPRGLAPQGWRVPTEEDWRKLEQHLGMNPEELDGVEFRGKEENVGGKLKETGSEHWDKPNTGATNETGFAARAGGYRDNDGPFNFFGKYAAFWTATGAENGRVWFRGMTTTDQGVYRFSFNQKCGFSVRCVRDVE